MTPNVLRHIRCRANLWRIGWQFALPGWVDWERRSRIRASIGYAWVLTKDIAGLD